MFCTGMMMTLKTQMTHLVVIVILRIHGALKRQEKTKMPLYEVKTKSWNQFLKKRSFQKHLLKSSTHHPFPNLALAVQWRLWILHHLF